MASSSTEAEVFSWDILNRTNVPLETSAGTYYIPNSKLTPWELEDLQSGKATEEMKSKTEYKNYFYKDRAKKNGPSTKLGLNLPTDYLDFHEGARSGFLSIPISFTSKGGLWSRSFEVIRVKWGMPTTIQQIENALLHITQHTKFKSLKGTHNRYTYDFDEADTALIKLLIDEVYNSKSKRVNYSWIEPLQELICNREVKRIEKKKKAGLKFKTPSNEHKWGAPKLDELYIPTPAKIKWTPTPPMPKKEPSPDAHTEIMVEFEKESQQAIKEGRLQPAKYIELKKDLHQYLDSETKKRIKNLINQSRKTVGLKSVGIDVVRGGMAKSKELITGTPQFLNLGETITNTGTISAVNVNNTNYYRGMDGRLYLKDQETNALINITPTPMNESNEEKWKD